jgi:hypothetical protein
VGTPIYVFLLIFPDNTYGGLSKILHARRLSKILQAPLSLPLSLPPL